MSITDYTYTNNPRSIHIAESAATFPEWVSREAITRDSVAHLSPLAFADRDRRLLPVHEKSAAFYSAIDYFANVASYPEDTFDRIKEACDHFGIGNDVAPYACIFSDVLEKQSSEPTVEAGRFAIDTCVNDTAYKLLPLNDFDDVTKSARDLTDMLSEGRIHYLMFVDAARSIVKAASDHGVSILPNVIVEAGKLRFEDFEKAAALVESRRQHCDSETFAHYESAIKEAAGGDITADDCMRKIAATDTLIGLPYAYHARRPLPLPHEIVFCGPSVEEVEKAARQLVMVKGVTIPYDALIKIDNVDLDFHLDKAASEDFRQARDSSDALQMSLAVAQWSDDDQRSLLRLTLKANQQ